jgi:hypothetical protein
VPTGAARSRGEAERSGWELAYWAVAHSDELRIERVSYGNRIWSAGNSRVGWRTADEDSGPEVRIVTAR